MNTDTGNIFLLGDDPLAKNEVELSRKQFAEMFPMRALEDRLKFYRKNYEQSELDRLKEVFKP